MPILDDAISEGKTLARILLYGPAKLKKTWWALRAAEQGFNVIHLDSDGEGWQIGKLIAAKARRRILTINLKSRFNQPIAAGFMARFLKGSNFIWDEDGQDFVPHVAGMNSERGHVIVSSSKLTPRDVIVVDSWTSKVESFLLQVAKDSNIDLASGDDLQTARDTGKFRDLFFQTGAVADWVLDQLTALPCHLIVIGHVQTYEKKSRDGKNIEWVRTQPISTSGNHAAKLAKKFSDVFFFKQVGIDVRISSESKADRDGGSRIVPPADYVWGQATQMYKSLNFEDWMKYANVGPITDNEKYSSKAFTYYKPGEVPEVATSPIVAKSTSPSIGNAAAPASPLKIQTGAIAKVNPFAKK